jgi:hypothetical protein
MAFKSVVRKTTYILGDTSFEGRRGLLQKAGASIRGFSRVTLEVQYEVFRPELTRLNRNLTSFVAAAFCFLAGLDTMPQVGCIY